MLLVYQEEVELSEQAEREKEMPISSSFTAACVRQGCWWASSVCIDRERDIGPGAEGETEITDGPFAVTKEVLAGYYILDCADLDEALKQAARVPAARWGTVEVRPVMAADHAVARIAREAGADLPDEAVEDMA